MGNKQTVESMFTETAEPNYRTECAICSAKCSSITNNQRCMSCGNIACRLCLKTEIDEFNDTYSLFCKICNEKREETTENFIDYNLREIIKNHKDNGRELLVYGYIRVLWISHCLLYGVDYNSRFPSNDVIQCIMLWLYIKDQFDKTNIDKNIIKLTNCNQCIERISSGDSDICHIFGSSSIKFPGFFSWKFAIKSIEKEEIDFIVGIVVENKIDRIGIFEASIFNETAEFGYGVRWINLSNHGLKLQIDDIIIMTLDLNDSVNMKGLLTYRIYRDNKCLSDKWPLSHKIPCYQVNIKNTYKLAVAMYNKDKLTLLDEWW